MSDTNEQTLPRSIVRHLELYPEAYATERGLERINAKGKVEVLVSIRKLSETYPGIQRSSEAVSTPKPVVAIITKADSSAFLAIGASASQASIPATILSLKADEDETPQTEAVVQAEKEVAVEEITIQPEIEKDEEVVEKTAEEIAAEKKAARKAAKAAAAKG